LGQCGVPHPHLQQISSIDTSALTANSVMAVAADVWREYTKLGGSDQVAKGPELSKALLEMHRQEVVQELKADSHRS